MKPWYKDLGRSATQMGHHKKRLLDRSDDLYSQFSKQSYQTYQTIKTRTESRLSQQEMDQRAEVLSKLKNNQYIPMTLQQFLEKQSKHTGKKIYFSK